MGTMAAALVLSQGNNWTLDLEKRMLDANAMFTPLIKALHKPLGMPNLDSTMKSRVRL